MTKSVETEYKEWNEILKKLCPDVRLGISYSWAENYRDFEYNFSKYKVILDAITKLTKVGFIQRPTTDTDFIQKVCMMSKILFRSALNKTKAYFTKEYDRYMYPPEYNNLSFTLVYIKALRTAVPFVFRSNFPVYVFESVADAILDWSSDYFDGINIQIIKNTWE